MTAGQFIGFVVGAYLALLARSAWKQGEFRQFALSLGAVILLLGIISGIVWTVIWLDGGW